MVTLPTVTVTFLFTDVEGSTQLWDQPERAAQLLGAAEILREKIKINMSPPEQAEYQKGVARSRSGMDENSFKSHSANGRAMSMEDANALAINGTAGLAAAPFLLPQVRQLIQRPVIWFDAWDVMPFIAGMWAHA